MRAPASPHLHHHWVLPFFPIFATRCSKWSHVVFIYIALITEKGEYARGFINHLWSPLVKLLFMSIVYFKFLFIFFSYWLLRPFFIRAINHVWWKYFPQFFLFLRNVFYSSQPLGWLLFKIENKITSAGENVKELEPLCTIGGNVEWYSLWKPLWQFLKKLKIVLIILFLTHMIQQFNFWVYIPRRSESRVLKSYLCIRVYRVLFITAPT